MPDGTNPAKYKQGVGQPKPLMQKAKAETIFNNLKLKEMKTKKMSLENIQGKLSRAEMKNIMAGSGQSGGYCINSVGSWIGSCCIPDDCITYCRSGQCACYNL